MTQLWVEEMVPDWHCGCIVAYSEERLPRVSPMGYFRLLPPGGTTLHVLLFLHSKLLYRKADDSRIEPTLVNSTAECLLLAVSTRCFPSLPSLAAIAVTLLAAAAPHLSPAQGTHLWTQSRLEEFEKGTPQGVALTSDGHLREGPA